MNRVFVESVEVFVESVWCVSSELWNSAFFFVPGILVRVKVLKFTGTPAFDLFDMPDGIGDALFSLHKGSSILYRDNKSFDVLFDVLLKSK
jgi:hypothetical protein